jgi:hypothetical protein
MIRLYGVDFWRSWGSDPELTKYDIIGLLAGYGANVIRIHLYAQRYLDSLAGNGDQHAAAVRAACARGKQLGVKVILSSHALTYDNSFQTQGNIIASPALQDQWITAFSQVIRDCNPDGIEIMNEPPDASLSGVAGSTFAAFRAFCVRAIEAYKAINPDLIFFIDGCPFYKPGVWATNPLPYDNLSYVVHYHYMGVDPPASWVEDYAVIHPYVIGDLATAKAALENFILNVEGVQSLINLGLSVTFTECGAVLTAPNAIAEITDLHNIALKIGAGFMQHAFHAYTTSDSMGMLNSDWKTLNALGQAWREINPLPPPLPVKYVLDVWAALGGTTNPTGIQSVESGTVVSITATAAQGYKFNGWQVQTGTAPVTTYPDTVNPLTLTITAATTVMPLFNRVPVTPTCSPGYHWDATVNACVQDTPPANNTNALVAGAAIISIIATIVAAAAGR